MLHVQSSPFLRIFIPFALGILFYKIIGSGILIAIALFVTTLGVTFFIRSLPFAKKIKYAGFHGTFLHLLLLSLGFIISFAHDVTHHKNWYKHHTLPESKIRAVIRTPLKETDRTYKANVAIKGVYNDAQQFATKGEALVYFKKTAVKPTLHVGDEIIFINKLNRIISKGNPGEFDYGAFCKNKGIYEQAFLHPSEWKVIPSARNKFQNPFSTWHEEVKNQIAQYIPSPKEKGIALALITGYRDEIDPSIYKQYTKTGLVHLLAISGLHMGIFYGGATYLLGLFSFFKKRKKLLIITSLIIMWVFALITTFPPSVQRASIMFSFLGFGQIINRKIPSVNFLFASAFLLLFFRPHLLFEVGFQLSYAAVLGILWFYIPIRSWYFPKTKFTQFLWNIMCLSFSAQLFTFPIALYYFHQLPLLFLFTNLLAIPAVTFIIGGEVFLILSAWFQPLAKIIGAVVSEMIRWLNLFIDWTASLTFVSIQNIHISLAQCILLLFLTLALAAWFLNKKKQFAPISLLFFITFLGLAFHKKYNALTQEKLIVYNAKQPYLEYINGTTAYSKDSISDEQKENFMQYTLQPSHLLLGLQPSPPFKNTWVQTKQYDWLKAGGKKILRIKKAYKLNFAKPISVDYLIISDPWIQEPLALFKNISPKEIIIDGNIALWKIEDLKTQLQEVDLPIYYVSVAGAKIIPL